jgi:hypothetical protein
MVVIQIVLVDIIVLDVEAVVLAAEVVLVDVMDAPALVEDHVLVNVIVVVV